jgi:hypothetical protein
VADRAIFTFPSGVEFDYTQAAGAIDANVALVAAPTGLQIAFRSAPGGGQNTLTAIILRGNGPNPIGPTNCT